MSDHVLPGRQIQLLRESSFTYDEVGATRLAALPVGYGHLRRSRDIGSGRERFEQASRTLLGWGMHRRAGVGVRASSERVATGAVAVLRLGWGRVGVNAPVRVVYLVDEPTRRGFAYGTLPGHPERGEESFVVELLDSGVVTFTITAFSQHDTALTRVAGPVTRVVQSRATNRYLRSV